MNNKDKNKLSVIIFLLIVLISPYLFNIKKANAANTVTASVRISVCGDLATEGSEECDNLDLNSGTCRSLGYFAGTLSCDVACDYDISFCYGVAPAATPTPSSTPTSTPTKAKEENKNSVNNNSTNKSSTAQTVSKVIVVPTFEIVQEPISVISLLPISVTKFDPNNDGTLRIQELKDILNPWVDEWVTNMSKNKVIIKNCDLNYDKRCNLTDLSVLLYYIEQQ